MDPTNKSALPFRFNCGTDGCQQNFTATHDMVGTAYDCPECGSQHLITLPINKEDVKEHATVRETGGDAALFRIGKWFVVIMLFCSGGFVLKGCTGGASATERYFTEVFAIIEQGHVISADYSRSGQISEMKKAFSAAKKVKIPSSADPVGVTRMRHWLEEGEDYYETTNGEWAIARAFGGGLVTGTIDAFGGGGLATGGLLSMLGMEAANDQAEAEQFSQATRELDLYIAGNRLRL